MQARVEPERLTMPVKRGKDGRWRYREVVTLPDGTRHRVSGSAPKHCNTRAACKQAFLDHIQRLRKPADEPRKEVPTFSEWFEGRFWHEWVVSPKNRPTERLSKRRIYKNHLRPYFGQMQLDAIGVSQVARFRASLVSTKRRRTRTDDVLSEKYINNILGVLSKTLRYAEDVQLIGRAPKVGIFRAERPEVECWDFYQYARMLAAALAEGPEWYAATCLAGEASLRIGEVKGLRLRDDLDFVAGTLTVQQQIRDGIVGPPKGRTRRTIPMTARLVRALRQLPAAASGYAVSNPDGSPLRDGQASHAIYRICRRANLPERAWHTLRHSFGTHAAHFGANPWRLMQWMGHKRIDETMRYVHFVEAHMRPLPKKIIAAGQDTADPDRRVFAMLSARGDLTSRGKSVAKTWEETPDAE